MIGPPDPGIPALLLTVAAKLGYRVTAHDPAGLELGTLVDGTNDKVLVMASAGEHKVEWVITDPTPRLMPHLLSRETFALLQNGRLEDDGTISYQGQRYRIESWFDGAQLVAQPVRA